MWNERYSEPGFAFGTDPNDFLRSVARRLPPEGRVLCLAEGEGRNAVYLAGLGHRVLAVDASEVGLEKAARLAVERGVELETRTADLAEFEIEPASFDAVVSIFAHLPPPLRARVHRDVVAGLAPGGAFVLEAYTPAQVGRGCGGPPVAELMMTLRGLRDELEGLTLEIGRELERDVQEGRYHNGMSAVVQVLGWKPREESGR